MDYNFKKLFTFLENSKTTSSIKYYLSLDIEFFLIIAYDFALFSR